VLSLWLHQNPGAADRLILNSPWLEFQASKLGRAVVSPFIALRAKVDAATPLRVSPPTFYYRATACDFEGEWSFDPRWKPVEGFSLPAPWVQTVLEGHAQVAHGLSLDVPVLVMLSDRSYLLPMWDAQKSFTSDVVLEVEEVAKAALK